MPGKLLLMIAVIFIGCQKSEQEIAENEIQTAARADLKNGCRLVSATNTDPTFSQDFRFHYNEKGKADKWEIENYGLFSQEYDGAGRLIKSIHTVEGIIMFTAYFFYNGDRVERDVYYYGTGTDVLDEGFYSYDVQGRMVKVQSIVNDYITITKYTPAGNILSNEFSYSGVPFYSQYFQYNAPHKNPFLAVPGIAYNFPYYLPAFPFYSKWRFSSIKEVMYDENGNQILLYAYEPSKTIWQVGHQNYVLSATYFDQDETPWEYKFEYENCGPASQRTSADQVNYSLPIIRKAPPSALLKRFSGKPLKEQVKEIRELAKSLKF